tara:strand:- start:386 stop:574 length:189 start_codon:yes stop_codon:yes gene_type:complete
MEKMVMKYKENKLTSVNVNDNNRKEFKKIAIDEDITFQKLVNIALELYITDVNFRKAINKRR